MRPLLENQIRTAVLTVLLFLAASHSGQAKLPETAAAGLSNWSALIPHPLEENKFLAAAQNSIYVTSSDSKDPWKKWPALPATGLKIQKLLHFPALPENVFVLTDKGIYKTSLAASGYETVYEKRKLGEKITDFAIAPEDMKRWFVGTGEGVLESKDAGKTWHLFTPAGKEAVCFIRFSDKHLFVAHPDHLLFSENLSRFQKVFSLSGAAEDPETLSAEPEDEDGLSFDSCLLRDIAGSGSQGRFWLATGQGIFESRSPGLSWTGVSSGGLLTRDIYYLTQDMKTKKLFAAGRNRIYELSPAANRWREISLKADASLIRGISAAGENLTVVTASGLMTHLILPDGVKSPSAEMADTAGKELFQKLVRLEPTALQLQRVVSRYHHTQNSKISRWQAESRLRALLPTVSFKKDFSFGNNIDIDRRGTNDPDQFIEGPADTSRGWDFGVGWDLGDLIFSTSQTSIDSREKLMMELRHELLSEATRLYYERRRLQAEMLFVPSISEDEHFSRLFQIEELTALLDGMTNGFMNKQIEMIYKENPELEKLWIYPESGEKTAVNLRGAGPADRTQH